MDRALIDAFAQNRLIGREVHKMNGAGNAILVLDLRGAGFWPTPEDARALARAPGLAYDQLMALGDGRERGEAAFMTIFNQDGSLSAACGNGARCVAHYLAEQTGATEFRLATSAGRLTASRVGALDYTVDMGRPRLDWRDIPLAREADTTAVELGHFGLPPASCVSMGNPHAIFFVEDVDAFNLEVIGPKLEQDSMFPQRANISLAQPLTCEHIRLKVWERGTGPTLACGTAACATGVAAARAGLCGREVRVSLPGGDLLIHWRESDDHVEMTGPVEAEFSRVLDAAVFAGPND